MSSLELQNRSLAEVIIEASICLTMNVLSIVGNVLVCLAVYKNPKLRSSTNLYIIALAASDLLCATAEMPSASAVLITQWKMEFRRLRVSDSGFYRWIRWVLNSSNNGFISVQPVRTNRREVPLQQDLFTAQI